MSSTRAPAARSSRRLVAKSRGTSPPFLVVSAALLANHLEALLASPGSALDVEPGSSGPGVAEALAPDGDRLAGIRDGDLAVVSVDLAEAVLVDVAGRAGGSIVDLHGRGPAL